MRRASVRIAVKLEYVEMSVAAALVYAVTLRVDEQIIGIATGIDRRNIAAVLHREHAEPGGVPECNENSPGLLIERHRKEALIVDRPACHLLAGETVDDLYHARLREIHEDAADRTRQLKAFGVRGQGKVENLPVRRRIDLGQTAAPITHENPVRRRIHANIIRIFSQIDTA